MTLVMITDSDLGDGTLERDVLRGHDVAFLAEHSPTTDVQGLLVQWTTVDNTLLDRFPNVRAIVRYGIGLDNIDLSATEARGIRVANVPDYCLDEVASHTTAMIATRARRLTDFAAHAADGRWSVDGVDAPLPAAEDPVGVAGLGRIGRLVAGRVAALGHPVVAWDPLVERWPSSVARAQTLAELATAVNHLTLHVPLTAETQHVASSELFAALGPRGHLVNTSRGGLIDEHALLTALDRGQLGYASLDVLAGEPPTGTSAALVRHPRTTVTPHAAYLSTASRTRLQTRAAQILKEILDDLG